MGQGNASGRAQEVPSDPPPSSDRNYQGRTGEEPPAPAERPEYHRRHTMSGSHSGPAHHRLKRVERSISMSEKTSKSSQLPPEPHYVSLSTASSASHDDVGTHVQSTEPRGVAPVSATIVVNFDMDIKTIQEDKLFEVHCLSRDPSLPIKGKTIHNANTNKVEFIPHNSLLPRSKYEVKVLGNSVTTSQCTNSRNISNYSWSFETNVPTSRSIKVKLKDEKSTIVFTITEEMYQNLYLSLVEWGVRRFGISGEYIKEISTSDPSGFHVVVHSDRDILGIKEDQTVTFDIRE